MMDTMTDKAALERLAAWLIGEGFVLEGKGMWVHHERIAAGIFPARFCNLAPRVHMDKWYAMHNGRDYYYCPDCDDCQIG